MKNSVVLTTFLIVYNLYLVPKHFITLKGHTIPYY